MTVYTDNPFGGIRNPMPYGGGIAGGLMNRPPPFMPQQPMPQMPRRMPGGPSKGGTTSIPMRRPPMQRPGGPGKGRPRGRFMRGGPGKGRGQMQQPMPARPSFGQLMTQGPMNMPRPTPRPVPFMGQTGQIGRVGNNPPQMQPMPARPSFEQLMPGGSGFSGPSVPDFGQRRTQGPIDISQYQRPMNMGQPMPQPPMDFPQPTLRPDQTMGRPMPQPNFILGPMNRGGFYSGGITDLY
tara:strand:- start:174 stop:887 length:714 start_codon:yes stop_codon:yes gene_type:complete